MSTPQTVTTVVVFDYLLDTAGQPVVGAAVHCTLQFNQAVISPTLSIGSLQQTTSTDSNGYYQFSVVPNATLTPPGSVYLITTPYNSYEIQVPTMPGPFWAPGLVVFSSSLAPSSTSIQGPLTIATGPLTILSGGESVTGGLTVTSGGATVTGLLTANTGLTVAGGATVTGGETVTGLLTANTGIAVAGGATIAGGEGVTGLLTANTGLTVAGLITQTDTASRVVPGATSWSLRNHANSQDDLLVADGGNTTVAGTLTGTGLVTASAGLSVAGGSTLAGGATVTGGETVTGLLTANTGATVTGLVTANTGLTLAGSLTQTDAASRVVPGATSWSLRNHANSQDDLIVLDGGNTTVAGTLTSTGLVTASNGVTTTNGESTDVLTVRGLTGAANSSRYVGSTTTLGPPASGTFLKGDHVIDQNGLAWICTTAGTPGTWQSAGSGLVHAEVYNNTAQSIPTGASFTVINYDTKEADPMGWYSTTSHTFTPQLTGRYLVNTSLAWASANGGQGELGVFYNGALVRLLTTPNSSHVSLGGSAVVRVTVINQALDIRILQQSGGAINTVPGANTTHAQITYLGAL